MKLLIFIMKKKENMRWLVKIKIKIKIFFLQKIGVPQYFGIYYAAGK